MTHIPGPWMLHDMEAHTVVTERKPGRFIALCDGGKNTEEENAGIARLIIAAPKLLAALEEMVRVADGSEPCVGGLYELKLARARDAIAGAVINSNEEAAR